MPSREAAAPAVALTLRVLARLLAYPDAELRAQLPALAEALTRDSALPQARTAELQGLIADLAGSAGLEAEAAYVELFDRGRATALHLFEHVHGDSRDRGPAMIDLLQTYEQAGLFLKPGELPDHLAVLLEYASTQPPAQARALLAEVAHLVQNIHGAVARRHPRYAAPLAAILDLAGEPCRAAVVPDEPGLDESWEEPPAFDGCSPAAPARAGAGGGQPVHLVRPAPNGRGPSPIPGASA
ncbi:MAG: nitrate reductase molybdenum cofactor assembly chaperone [Burkholderiaceae bacterium]